MITRLVVCLLVCRHQAKDVLIHRKIAVECVQVIKDKGKTLFPDQNRTEHTRPDKTPPHQIRSPSYVFIKRKEGELVQPVFCTVHTGSCLVKTLRGVLIMYEQYASAKTKEIWSQMCSAGLKRVSKRP